MKTLKFSLCLKNIFKNQIKNNLRKLLKKPKATMDKNIKDTWNKNYYKGR